MALKQRWQQKMRTFLIVVAAIVLIMGALALLIFGYLLSWKWTGFLTKTLWDWMQILIVPVVLAIGGFWLNHIQKSREERSTEMRKRVEQEIAADNQRAAALQAYIDTMSELLFEKGLRESQPEDEVRIIARARTLSVLRGLDAGLCCKK
jgi:hypothetical protein